MSHFSSSRRAFTLIEMLAVMAIIAIVAVFVVPAATSILKGSQLTQASAMLTDQFSLARQQALTKNTMVEVRLIRFSDPEQPGETLTNPTTGKFRALQLMQVLPSGVAVPLSGSKVQMLPTSITMSSGTSGGGNQPFSTLLPASGGSATSGGPQYVATPASSDPDMPRNVKNNYNFYAFRFLPDGSTNLLPTSQWYVTLLNINDQTKLTTMGIQAINFFTLQLDPVSGSTRSYRPTAK